ncbi:hypothetical protein NT6N_10220 [Oceaniferula spumae]|uniref:Ice-binding protein C-terminal domain-containing protein n=1 Tax=Oceaniferula spumae TaxID=2979115 RepID=A0AAT9FJ64_9BACT
MKKSIITIGAPLVLSHLATASVLVSDNFDYTDGSLVPNGGWANHSGTVGDLLVAGGQAVVQHGTPSEDANLAFTPTAGKLYYGFDFSVGDLGAPYSGVDNEYFAHFKDDAFAFRARMDILEPSAGGDFSVGISSDSSTAEGVWATDLTYDTFYRAIVEYDQVAGVAKMWINAALETDTSVSGAVGSADAMTQFALRQSDSSENETITVDGLVVGTAFSDVVNPVPEPSSFALLGLAGLAAMLRRRN